MGATVRVATVAAAAVLVLVTTACGGNGGSDAADTAPPTAAETSAVAAAGEPVLVARTSQAITIYTDPDGAADQTLDATTEFGSPRALLVLSDAGDWLEVALPERPNGSTGWIRRADVELRPVSQAISIDLASRTLTLSDAGQVVMTTPVAIGTTDAPTPTGPFYVVDKLDTGDPDGPYGRFAFGLSAHSNVLTDFGGGDGQIGIHGTNEPELIGQAVSHGCIRVPNEVAEALNDVVQLGTPVTIR
jgi:lipoprotein-anchoring transpeptidase ErfK/SrfK